MPSAVYETVKKKEVEKRKEALTTGNSEPRFADVLKQQWEAKKKELEAQKAQER